MGQYLNFNEISSNVSFSDLLNYLNIPFKQTNGELKGDYFSVNVKKNLYINTKDDTQKGSVINFLSHHKEIDLRTAAQELKDHFLTEAKPPKREIPDLELHYPEMFKNYGIGEELSKEYEVGLVKQKSIMSGKIAFRVRDGLGQPTGYVGYTEKDGSWFFPKGFKRPLYNGHRLMNSQSIVLVVSPFDALKVLSFGWTHVGALMGKSVTDEQFRQVVDLPHLKQVLLIHPDPENIVLRLSLDVFVKHITPMKEVRDMTKKEFLELIK